MANVNPVRENICILQALDIGITGTLVTELAAIRVSLWPLHRHIMGELARLTVHWRGIPKSFRLFSKRVRSRLLHGPKLKILWLQFNTIN